MNAKKRVALVVIVVVLTGAAAFLLLERGRREDFGNIALSGNIELRTVDLAFKNPGKIMELNVEEGDFVEEGQVIARLDSEELLRQKDQAVASLASARSRLAEIQASLEYQTEMVQAQIQQRGAELTQVQLVLEELLSGSREQEIDEARAALERAQSELARADRDWNRAQTLYRNEDISTAQHDQFRSARDSSAATVRQFEERLDLIIEGPRREDIEEARAHVTQARATLKLAEAQRLDLKRNEQAIETARAEVQVAQAQIALIEKQLQDTVLLSPANGVVLVKVAEAGEVLAAGTLVVEVGDLAHPWLRGYIGEQDLGRVKLGSTVRVRTDSFPDKVYEGRVSFISSEAEFTPKQIQTPEERVKLVYRIKIDIPNPEGELKLNMPVDAEILVSQREQAGRGGEGGQVTS